MSTHAHPVTSVSIPSDLETSRAKLVYLYVATQGETTIDDVCATLDLNKGTALTITNALRDRDHVRRDGELLVPAE